MAKAAGEVVPHIESARKSGRMWITAGSSDDVTAHAKGLAGPAVAARARKWIEARGLAMSVWRTRWARPTGWMRVPTGGVLTRDAEPRVTIHAEELAVASDALPRIGGSLLVMHGNEIGPVHGVPHRLVEPEPGRNRGDGDAVTCGALALGVAARAEVTLCVGLHSMLTKEVAIVNHVTLGDGHLPRQVDMAPAAVPGVPLPLVRMTAEASRVFDAHVVGVDRHVDVTSHAVAGLGFGVCRV